ncbi:hypothetical protein [Rhodanobacter glycinis]|uniref:hypothetical protein n=1 Tax=Rhodanobacter glycinis TaxID=582702 RepID=UPI0019601425|nr:hypothetical protein [Rhodanobacter glycinis]
MEVQRHGPWRVGSGERPARRPLPRHAEEKTTNARFQRITPFRWFDDQAEQAATFYTCPPVATRTPSNAVG